MILPKPIILLLSLLVLPLGRLAASTLPSSAKIEEAIRRANDYFISQHEIGNARWFRGAYQTGNFRAYETLHEAAYLKRALDWANTNDWQLGIELRRSDDADSQACAQTYLDLYQLDPKPERIAAIKTRADELVADPKSEDDWWWIDAFYMAGPTLAHLGKLYPEAHYTKQMHKMYLYLKNQHSLFDPKHGLWYRDARAKAKTGENTPEFWSRGNGWVIAACARILEQLPADDPRRGEYSAMLQTMAAALRPLQGDDGFWRSNLEHPAHFPEPETSGTAFFTYAIAYGINHGLLDANTYTPVVNKAWHGLTTIALHDDGMVGNVQSIGAAPGPTTSDGQQDYGYGAFLLAGCEMLRLQQTLPQR